MHLDPLVAADNSLIDSSGPSAGIDPAAGHCLVDSGHYSYSFVPSLRQ